MGRGDGRAQAGGRDGMQADPTMWDGWVVAWGCAGGTGHPRARMGARVRAARGQTATSPPRGRRTLSSATGG
eukprot:4421563-Prymnesium_polylepis.1